MPRLRLFAAAREAAGTAVDELPGATVGEVLAAARQRYGDRFAEVLDASRVWVDGEPAEAGDPVPEGAEVAVLPPVSGGAGTATGARAPGGQGAPPTTSTAAAVRATGPTPLVDRLFEPVDTAGPKAALALAWVGLQALALLGGRWTLAALFGLVAAVAGLHAARAWRRHQVRANRALAGLLPLLVPLAAALGAGAAGMVVLAGVAASLVAAAVPPRGRSGRRRRRRAPLVAVAGTTVRCWLPPALAAASVVMVYRVAPEAAAGLLVLLAGYDVAAYLWGAGGGTGPLVGRLAGVLTVGVLTFALSTVELVLSLPPFQQATAVWVFGGLAATLAPLGQLAASAVLPSAAAPAPALRRLDSLLLAGPAWAFALWGYTG